MSSINYDLKKIKGIAFDVDGVLSPSTIPLSPEGEPLRMVSIKDGYALQLAVKKGLKIAIITGGNTKAVDVRFRGLGIDDVFLGSSMKLPILQQWMEDNGLSADEVAFVGDDIPDIQAMQHVGLAVAPADATDEVTRVASYISPKQGGYGVGRETLEQVMKSQDLWHCDHQAFGW